MAMEKQTYTKAELEQLIEQQVAKMNKEFELKQEQREKNVVELGVQVTAKRVQKGQPIIDKTTNKQKMIGDVPQCYPDKYFVMLSASGFEFESQIDEKETFEDLEDMKKYLAVGRMGLVTNFGVTELKPIITKFTKI